MIIMFNHKPKNMNKSNTNLAISLLNNIILLFFLCVALYIIVKYDILKIFVEGLRGIKQWLGK
jgi:hypothetical protein